MFLLFRYFAIFGLLRTAILLSIASSFSLPSWAYEYSIQHAYCTDHAKNKSRTNSSSFHYDMQVAYNACMKDANNLIRVHEQHKKESADRYRRQQAEQIEKEKERKQQEQLKKQQEEQRIKKMTEGISDHFH